MARWALAGILTIFVGTGSLGIDYGTHWDEWNQFHAVQTNISDSLIVPRFHIYPAVMYWITYLPSVFDGIGREMASVGSSDSSAKLREARANDVRTWTYRKVVRALFLFISAFAIGWIFLAARKFWHGEGWGLLAAALLGGSWEFAYHARWVASDAVHCQFVSLSMLCLVLGLSRKKPRFWLGAAAAAAGLATATKYPGGLSLLPVMGLALFHPTWKADRRDKIEALGLVVGIFAVTYFVVSPALLVYPKEVLEAMKLNQRIYSTGFFGYSVQPGLDHAERLIWYLGTVALSPFAPVAFLLASLAPLGMYVSWRKDRKSTVILLLFPVSYFLFFSLHAVMIVRNYLVLFPYLIFFAAGGAAFVWERLPRYRTTLVTGAALIFFANATWLGWSAYSIANPAANVERALAYVRSHPGKKILVGPGSGAALKQAAPDLPNLVTSAKESFDEALLQSFDIENLSQMPSIGEPLFTREFGPWAANPRYYVDWHGNPPYLLISNDELTRLGVKIKGQ